MEDETLRRSMLFDFYGELLTCKQREYYDLHYNEDLSLGEIAEQAGISRQGVWDMIRRADKTMREAEDKLHMAVRFTALRRELGEIESLLETALSDGGKAGIEEALRRLRGLEI